MAREKRTYTRPVPAHKRLMGGKALERAWGDQGLVAQAPAPVGDGTDADPYAVFDAAVDGAVDKTLSSFQSVQERRQAQFEARRQAQAQAQKPGAAGAIEAVAEDLAAEEAAAERKAVLDSMTKEERNSWFQQLLEYESDDSAVNTGLSDDDDFDFAAAQERADLAGQELMLGEQGEALAQDLTDEAWSSVLEDGDEA